MRIQTVIMLLKVVLVLVLRLTVVKANESLVEGEVTFSQFAKVEVLEGESAKLRCTSGMPTQYCMFSDPNATDLHNVDPDTMSLFNVEGLEMDTSDNVCGVIIGNVKKQHEGRWKCQVHVANLPNTQPGGNWWENGYKKIERELLLQILPPTSKVVMTWKESGLQANSSTDLPIQGEILNITLGRNNKKGVILGCPLSGAGQETIDVNWTFYKGQTPSRVESSERFHVTVNREDNGATVTCNVSSKRFSEIQNSNGDNVATVVVNVLYRPEVLNMSTISNMDGRYKAIQVEYRANPMGQLSWAQKTGHGVTEFGNSSTKYISLPTFTSTLSLINKDVYKAVIMIPLSEIEDNNGTVSLDVAVENSVGTTTQEIQFEDFRIPKEEEMFGLVQEDVVASSNLGLYVGVAIFVTIIIGLAVGLLVVFKKRLFFFKNFGKKDPLECCLQDGTGDKRGPGDGSSIEDGGSEVDDSWSKEEANSSSNEEKI